MLDLARRAIDAAMAAGAVYADVRVTHTLREVYQSQEGGRAGGGHGAEFGLRHDPSRIPVVRWGAQTPTIKGIGLLIGVGVRAFYNGYWGFAASPYWTDDNVVALGYEATRQAKANASAGAPRSAMLGTVPIVRDGRWVMSGIDPFTVPVDEKIDFLMTLLAMVQQQKRRLWGNLEPIEAMDVWREERVFASSEGASYSQVRYRSQLKGFKIENTGLPLSPFYARGWDSLVNLKLNELLPAVIEKARQHSTPIPRKAVDVGRYDIVLGAPAAAWFTANTVGYATELDRALGFEANAAGTSYLGPDPLDFLGTAVASPVVTVTANRSTPGALATTQWDDEGVVPDAYPLIHKGILVDYHTTREQAQWLAPWYEKHGQSIKSHGCAVAATALDEPIQMCPNLVLEPSTEQIRVEDLIKDTKRGIYWPTPGFGSGVDQQLRNGTLCSGAEEHCPREIRDGKLGAYIGGGGSFANKKLGAAIILFNSMEFWKNAMVVGSAEGTYTMNERQKKGQPSQRVFHAATAVPMKVKELAVVDGTRRA
jgi:TldD protein